MSIDRLRFNQAYDSLIRGDHFFEAPEYYDQQRARYRNTLLELEYAGLGIPRHVLEVGGGQILLLGKELFGYSGVVTDVNDQYSAWIKQNNLEFRVNDLVHDDLRSREEFDLVVLCEVIEHIAIPQHLVLEKIYHWLKPGGTLFLTTPNLYRFRNLVRLARNQPLFCPLYYPKRGEFMGHPCEFSPANLRWQLDRACFTNIRISPRQLVNHGSSMGAHVGRMLAAPLLWARESWRDQLLAFAERPKN